MTGTILILIIGASIGLYHDTTKPAEYELSMEDGTNKYVVLQKNGSYACPLYCEVDHIHHAIIIKDESQIKTNQFLYHISENSESGVSIYCSNKKILSINRFRPRTKLKLPDVVSTSSKK